MQKTVSCAIETGISKVLETISALFALESRKRPGYYLVTQQGRVIEVKGQKTKKDKEAQCNDLAHKWSRKCLSPAVNNGDHFKDSAAQRTVLSVGCSNKHDKGAMSAAAPITSS